MGNVAVHFCPQVSTRFTSKYRRMRNQTTEVFDGRRLCSGEGSVSHDNGPSPEDTRNDNEKGGLSRPTIGPRINREYLSFPFLFDDELAYWITNLRFMFILRGPPGSGKSFITECLKLRYPAAQICSADDFWYLESGGSEYQFDVSRIAEAHQWCQDEAYRVAASGVSPVVIDNTNVRAWETRYYTDLARKFEYMVIMVTPQTPWRFDPDALATRNVHFVSFDTVEAKVRNFEPVFPLYYGWLWPGLESANGEKSLAACEKHSGPSLSELPACWPLDQTRDFLAWAWDAFLTIVGIPDVHVQLASALSLPDTIPIPNILQHWMSATHPPFSTSLTESPAAAIPHITARFSRFGRDPGAEQYGLSAAVTESLLGRLFTVQVTGLFFSLRTVGARIRLPADDLVLRHLWASDDQVNLSTDESAIEDRAFHGNRLNHAGLRPVGCRAHVTLALAPDVSAVETGLDLLRIVDAELDDRPGEHVAIVPGGSVRRVTVRRPATSPTHLRSPSPSPLFLTAPTGYEYMYVFDLDVPQHHRVLFSAVY